MGFSNGRLLGILIEICLDGLMGIEVWCFY